MSETPHLGLTFLEAAQAQKHVTVNEGFRRLDALVHLTVDDRDLREPPAAPADGARYIVPPEATGVFLGKTGQVAAYQDGAWSFLEPRTGWLAFVVDEARLVVRIGAGWAELATAATETQDR
jgi:hypothetical protein